jgi:hypothetical protein
MTQTPTRPSRQSQASPLSSLYQAPPRSYDIEDGELAVNFNASEPGLFISDLDDEGDQADTQDRPSAFWGLRAQLDRGPLRV